MIFLVFSVLCSAGIYVVFKLFKKFHIDTFQAIVYNYLIAASFGFFTALDGDLVLPHFSPGWIWTASAIGILFISLFYLMAISSQKLGVSVTGMATKMSMLIPVLFFAATDADESPGGAKWAAIALGVLAVILVSGQQKAQGELRAYWWLPLVVFTGSGILDLVLAYTEKHILISPEASQSFTPLPFAVAACIGIGILVYRFIRKGVRPHFPTFIGGLVLGLINYGSIYFFLLFLGSGFLIRSASIPLNNLGVVLVSSLAGFLLFSERPGYKTAIGLILAVISMMMLIWL